MLSAGRRARSKASKSRSRRVRREKAGRCGEAHIPFQNGAENRILLLRRPQFTIPMPTPSVNRLASKSRKLPACEPCRAMKLRCDHGRPSCSRCRTRGLADGCVYRTRPFKRRLTRSLSGQELQGHKVAMSGKIQPSGPEKMTQPLFRQMLRFLQPRQFPSFSIPTRAT